MANANAISPEKLARLIGKPNYPVLIDLCTPEDFALDPRLIPGSVRRSHTDVISWASQYAGKNVVAICQKGKKLSQGVAAFLRHAGAASAEALEGGQLAWAAAGLARWCQLPKSRRAMRMAAACG